MKRNSLCILFAGSLAGLWLAWKDAEAANPAAATSSQGLRQVLLAETNDETVTVDRREVLHPTKQADTATNAWWWQSGFVKSGNSWKEVERSDRDANTQLLDEYKTQRASAPMTADGQLKLANWCEAHHLKDQERAHLLQVLALSSPTTNPAPIYKRMGYRQLGDRWFSASDLQAMATENQKYEELRRQFSPKVEVIARNWNMGAKRRIQSQKKIDAIDDVAVLHALYTIAPSDESLALAICHRLDRITKFEASQMLAGIAVVAESPAVRDAAIESLKGRRLDDFVPLLLAFLHSPISVTARSLEFGEERIIFQEEKDRFVAIDLRYVPERVIIDPTMIVYRKQSKVDFPPRVPIVTRKTIDGIRTRDDIDFAIQQRIDEENDLTEISNQRASNVLAAVSGQDTSTDPRFWWAWWHIYSATQPLPKKYEIVTKKVVLPMVAVKRIPVTYSRSCLIAGTPIWTERGFVPIEQIQIGDRVLSKDVESGELEYKPVLKTTEREPVPVKRFAVARTTVVASDGHHFWSSGTGWMKTRELKGNVPIHTVTGMSRIESFESQPEPKPVYNLVVADFHTYFIGEAMILSHDVTPPAPTNVKVPGLVADVP